MTLPDSTLDDLIRKAEAAQDPYRTEPGCAPDPSRVKAIAMELRELRQRCSEMCGRDERDEALGVLASLADRMNIANREEGLREVEKYKSLGEMRGGIDALVRTLRGKQRKAEEELRRAREALDDAHKMGAVLSFALSQCACFCGAYSGGVKCARCRGLEEHDKLRLSARGEKEIQS